MSAEGASDGGRPATGKAPAGGAGVRHRKSSRKSRMLPVLPPMLFRLLPERRGCGQLRNPSIQVLASGAALMKVSRWVPPFTEMAET